MEILITKDFTWSHSGRLSRYKAGQVANVDTKTANQMIKAEYAVLAEQKMIDVSQAENKMLKVEIDNKANPEKTKKSKKVKEVDNE
jgi:hypothetical protein